MRLPPAALLLAAGCAVHSSRRAGEAPPTIRLGPDRTAVVYDDPREGEKRALLARINRDRAAAGVPPLHYEPRASLVGDLFCLDAALRGFWGHWDDRGRPPFVRWGLAGRIVWAWVVTIPASAVIAALSYLVLSRAVHL